MEKRINSPSVKEKIDNKKKLIDKEIWKAIDKEMAKHKIFKKVG